MLNSGDATLTTSVAAVYLCLFLSPSCKWERLDLTSAQWPQEDGNQRSLSLSTCWTSTRHTSAHLVLSRVPVFLNDHLWLCTASLITAFLEFVYAARSPRGRMGGWYGSLTCRCAACSPRGRCTSFTALLLQLCGVLAAELLDAVHTAYSLMAYSCDNWQRGKTQPACVNNDSHLASSFTASHSHTLVIGVSFVHLSLQLFSTAHHLYGVTIFTPTWKRKSTKVRCYMETITKAHCENYSATIRSIISNRGSSLIHNQINNIWLCWLWSGYTQQ